jgi:hypothetical protein
LASHIGTIVVVALDHSHISMAAEFLHCSYIAAREIQRFSDSCMAEAVRPDFQACFVSQLPDHIVKTGAGEPTATFPGPIQGIKQRTGSFTADGEPSFNGSFRFRGER